MISNCVYGMVLLIYCLLLEYLTISALHTVRDSVIEEVLSMCLGLVSFMSEGLFTCTGEFREKPEGHCVNHQQKRISWLLYSCTVPSLTASVPQMPSTGRHQAFFRT